ncbi:fatty-acid amide hydrolase 2-B isoform X2 [Diabrotica virgifera virgifera]|uniref:Amidase domain-containing protein n=3 Tax=Diabrotica virgifera virgifera TaxID=50390 RepID=A0ABM5KBM0_DIAVI|nr:fatty-acid amide hydrolase 2-B isoform X1 [Diabrotica virgifera virgifera]XP_050507587.1 fatty-acid amide hydrolase 2-B isoform X2 [Diabrotica virgifera virgifera]
MLEVTLRLGWLCFPTMSKIENEAVVVVTKSEAEKNQQFSKFPTTLVSVADLDTIMPPGIIAIRVLFWMVIKSVNVLYIPVLIKRIFRKSRACPPVKNEILLLSASELAERIRQQKVTCESVIKAYIARIQQVNPFINAVIEDRYQAAIDEAKRIDQYLSSSSRNLDEIKEKQPLLGVPISIKGSIEVAKMKSTAGMVTRANVIADYDAVTVKYAREAGAILLVTTNIPELCLNWESTNKLVGTTKNPYDTSRTCGGSSGGEASLLATAGSIIGIGSDIAGSLRLPAHFCGVWGHKPTPGTVSSVGHYPSCKHEDVWKAAFTLGPMSRYAGDLKLLLQVISEPNFRNKLRLDEPVDVKELRVFYVDDIQSALTGKVNEECLEAIYNVIEHLEQICHTNAEKIDLPLMKHAPELSTLSLLDIDDVDNLFTGRGEGSITELFRYMTFRSKSVLTAILYGVLRKLSTHLPRSTTEYCIKKLEELKADFVKILGTDGVFIIPSFTAEAHYHGDIYRKVFDSSYLSIFNSLGLPVTNCPVKFSKNGLPIGIQVVAAPYCDRLTLAVAAEIEREFGGWRPPYKT